MSTKGIRFIALTSAVAIGSGILVGAPAGAQDVSASVPSSTKGLYGKQDPTYDGAFRQGLAIIALGAVGIEQKEGLRWLDRQQCASGGFEAFRPDLAVPCQPPNNETFSGEDSNSTALAATAYAVAHKKKRMKRAISWLLKRQNSDGGWSFYSAPGASSDAASTSVVVMALSAAGLDPAKVRVTKKSRSAHQYLTHVQLRCSQPKHERGALVFQRTKPLAASNMTSAQASLGLVPLVSVRDGKARVAGKASRIVAGSPELKCDSRSVPKTKSTRGALLGYLARTLNRNDGAIPAAFGPGIDVGSTANAVTSLAAAGYARDAVKRGLKVLRKNAASFLKSPTVDGVAADTPGSLAYYILAVRATGGDPRDFAGTNLVARLRKTLR